MIRTTRAIHPKDCRGFLKASWEGFKEEQEHFHGGSSRGVMWRLTAVCCSWFLLNIPWETLVIPMCFKLCHPKGQKWSTLGVLSWELEWSNAPGISKKKMWVTLAEQMPLGWALEWEPVATRKSVKQIIFSLVLGLGLNIYNRKLVKIFVRWW